MQMRTPVVAASIAIALAALTSTAEACRCRRPAAGAAYGRADAVVLATVVKVEAPGQDSPVATCEVQTAWKASVPASFLLRTDATDCVYEVRPKETHLLFLHKDEDGQYSTMMCDGSDLLERASARLAWLKRHGRVVAVGRTDGPASTQPTTNRPH
jgi:hypothetical protein